MGISTSSFAVTKRCAKTNKVISLHFSKAYEKMDDTAPFNTNKSNVPCTGSMSLYCIQYKVVGTFQSHNNITYPRFIIATPLSGFSKRPYSPLRYILNI